MDYSFTEDQEMLRASFQDFLKKECPVTLVREIEAKKQDYSRELYEKMARLGWLGLMIPETYGGSGGNWVDMAIFYEEAGKALLPGPYHSTVVLGAQLILALGTDAQKRDLLPKIASGKLTLAFAIAEAEVGENISLMTTAARKRGDAYIINGSKLFVPYAHTADYILTVAKTESGASLFLVDRTNKGVTFTPTYSMNGETMNEVTYHHVAVPQEMCLGSGEKIILNILDKAKTMLCADMVGGAQVALQMAVTYSKERHQFGLPIGAYQALQHKMARMLMMIHVARWISYYAAWLNSEGLPSATEMAMAQLQAGEACRFVLAEATQVHGAVGVFRDHDLTLYFRRVKATQLNLGYRHHFQEKIAQSLGI